MMSADGRLSIFSSIELMAAVKNSFHDPSRPVVEGITSPDVDEKFNTAQSPFILVVGTLVKDHHHSAYDCIAGGIIAIGYAHFRTTSTSARWISIRRPRNWVYPS